MDNNFAELSTGQITFSSELAAFAQANAQNKFRSKVWKPSGYFRIVSGSTDVDGIAPNDKIYINDGSDLTISLDAGDYATPDLLATEIQTKLNATSSGWGVDYNFTAGAYNFRFTNASAFTLRFSVTTDSIWDAIGFTSLVDEVISTSRAAEEQRNHMFEFVIYDFGYNHPMEFFSVISPLDEIFSISNNATIRIQANNLNRWDSPPLDVTLTPSAGGLMKFFDDIADSSFRFFRFYFEDKYNQQGPSGFSFGYIYIGDYTTIVETNTTSGFTKEFVDPSKSTVSEQGAIYFDRKTKYTRFDSMGMLYLDKNNRDTLEELFYNFGTTTPFFISIDPKLGVSNELYDLTKYVIFDKQPRFTHVIRDLFNISMAFREVL